jgi:hypothetical protein
MKDNREPESNPLTKKEFDEILRRTDGFESFVPTCEDIVRYRSQATRLLLKLPCWGCPVEAQITKVVNGGEYFVYSILGMTNHWACIREVEILYMFPPQELTERIRDLETPVVTVGEVKKVLKKADKTNKQIGKTLKELFDEQTKKQKR